VPTAYDDLYAWIVSTFGAEVFTTDEFTEAFPSPAPRKVLSDLRRLGYVESTARGCYRAIPPERRIQDAIQRSEFSLTLPSEAGYPYALADETAVAIWTDGGYWTGFTRGFRPIHMRVRRSDVRHWIRFFRSKGRRSVAPGAPETLFGVVYVLHPATRVRRVERGGLPVIPAQEVLAFAEARPHAYEPVLRQLRSLSAREAS
jgi:hypothetical protein